MAEGDEFHAYEVVDRSHSVFVLMGELLGDHPMIVNDPVLVQKYQAAMDAIHDLYSAAGAKYL